MEVYPFENLFAFLAQEYGGRTLTRAELEQAGWPVPLHYLTPSGLKARKGGGYAVSDLVSYARLHSIPGEGIIKKTIIRPSRILAKERDPATGKISKIHIAAGFLLPVFPPQAQGESVGNLTFLCPFCGNLHFHGAGIGPFGDGDGERVPHCLDHENPAFMRRDIRALAKQLAPHWQFYLVETEFFDMLGDMPPAVKNRLSIRQRQGGTA